MTVIVPTATPLAPEGRDKAPTSVYRYYDAQSLLIYVGITSRGTARNFEHAGHKEWWPFVVRQAVEHFPDRPTALARERKLISSYHPPFNTQHNVGAAELREMYLAFSRAGAMSLSDHLAMYSRLSRRLPLFGLARTKPYMISYRTHWEHLPVASRAVIAGDHVPQVWFRNRIVGKVVDLELRAPHLTVIIAGQKLPDFEPPATMRVRKSADQSDPKYRAWQVNLDEGCS